MACDGSGALTIFLYSFKKTNREEPCYIKNNEITEQIGTFVRRVRLATAGKRARPSFRRVGLYTYEQTIRFHKPFIAWQPRANERVVQCCNAIPCRKNHKPPIFIGGVVFIFSCAACSLFFAYCLQPYVARRLSTAKN